MLVQKQRGQTFEKKQRKLKELELKKRDNTIFEIEQIQSDGNVVCDEQNLRMSNLESDMTKHLVANLRKMTKLQMVKSEMEKK